MIFLIFSKQHVWHVERILKTYCFWFSYTNMWHVEHISKKKYWISNYEFLWFSPKTCVTCWSYIEELLIVFDFLTNTCDMLKMYWRRIGFLWFSLIFSKQHVWHVERILKTYCFWFSHTNMWHVEHILKKQYWISNYEFLWFSPKTCVTCWTYTVLKKYWLSLIFLQTHVTCWRYIE